MTLFNLEKKPLTLPDEEGPKVTLTEKLFVPVKEHPDVSASRECFSHKGSSVVVSV